MAKSDQTKLPLPASPYIPGQPRPTGVEPGPVTFDPDRWHECREYLHAIELFNHGFYWEAHVWLEAVWHAAGRRSRAGQFLQGLIQLAAALLKRRMGCDRIAMRLFRAGSEKLRSVDETYLGVEPSALIAAVELDLGTVPEQSSKGPLARREKANDPLHGPFEDCSGTVPKSPGPLKIALAPYLNPR